MICSSTLSTKSYVHACTLTDGHEGEHRSIDGFWWAT